MSEVREPSLRLLNSHAGHAGRRAAVVTPPFAWAAIARC